MTMTPRTDWSETVDPNEQDRFEGYARIIADIQKKQAEGPTVVDRA